MKPEYHKQLEEQIGRVLKTLPPVSAPESLMRRVMAALEARKSLPWYRRSWQTWPTGLQLVSLAVLVASFGGLLFFSWELSRAAGYAEVMHEFKELFSGVGAIGNVIGVLFHALVLVVRQLGTPLIVGCLAAAALAYALFIGLGTVYLRLALLRRP